MCCNPVQLCYSHLHPLAQKEGSWSHSGQLMVYVHCCPSVCEKYHYYQLSQCRASGVQDSDHLLLCELEMAFQNYLMGPEISFEKVVSKFIFRVVCPEAALIEKRTTSLYPGSGWDRNSNSLMCVI